MSPLVQLHDLRFEERLSAKQISDRVSVLARELKSEIAPRVTHVPPLFVAVLHGAAIFHADLIRAFDGELHVGYIRTRSYVGTESSGHVQIEYPEDLDVRDRQVIAVEDIADSGRTLHVLAKALRDRGAASVTTVVLLDKPEARVVDFEPDFVGFTIDPAFVVGYGLDYRGIGRNLPSIYSLVEGGPA